MSYKSLYRKYRPTNFAEVVGQENITTILKNAILKEQVAHAYLFTGPRGTGKTSIAKIFSKSITCENNTTGEACGKCSSCELISNNQSMDIIEIDAASNNGVEEIKKVIENVHYAPTHLSHKIYIIDEVHMLSNSAFNALLKTIEEPPAHVVLIFATTEPHKIPSTIMSRCQRFDFRNLTKPQLIGMLTRVLSTENVSAEPKAIAKIAQLAKGGARDALSIADKLINHSDSGLTEEVVCDIFGLVDNQTKIDFINLLNSNEPTLLMEKIDTIFNSGVDLIRFTNDLLVGLKDVLVSRQTKTTKFAEVFNLEEIEQIKMNKKDILRIINLLLETNGKMKDSQDSLFHFQISCMEANRMLELSTDSQETVTIIEDTPKVEEIKVISTPEIPKQKPVESPIENPQESTSFEEEIVYEQPEQQNNDWHNEMEAKKVVNEDVLVEEIPQKPEISQNPEVSAKPKPVQPDCTIEDVVNVILQRDANRVAEFKSKIESTDMLLVSPKYQSYLSEIKDGEILSACENALLIKFDLKVQSDVINHMRKENNFLYAVKQLFGDFIEIYATHTKELVEIKSNWSTYSKQEIKKITPRTPQETNENLEFAQELFGSDLEII